jgi:hypothetical protein
MHTDNSTLRLPTALVGLAAVMRVIARNYAAYGISSGSGTSWTPAASRARRVSDATA